MLALLAAAVACTQLIVVDAPSRASTHATLSLQECGKSAGGPWPARVGRNGLSAAHREGDGTTPLGTFRIGPVVYGVAPDPGVRLAYHRLVCGDWWDGDPASPTYNRFRHLRCGTRLGGNSEALWTIRNPEGGQRHQCGVAGEQVGFDLVEGVNRRVMGVFVLGRILSHVDARQTG